MEFDYVNPDYPAEFRRRANMLAKIDADPQLLSALKVYYRDHIADFICDFGVTLNFKAAGVGKPSYLPFILYPRQRDWVDEVILHWREKRPLLTEKTRQMGFSWLAMATACSICLLYEGVAIGFASRKENLVDGSGDPASLFYKGRAFLENIPRQFRGGWTRKNNSSHMRLTFPETDSSIIGEAGDNIGRGANTSIHFVDEAAFIERPQLVEASLSQTTNCRIDISTPNGMANVFAMKRHSGNIDVFTFHWRDDPTKDDAWYEKQVNEQDPVVVAQEIDINYSASVEGVLIPSAWVQAAVDAHAKLGFEPTGARFGALDVADEGKDLNAFCGAHGVVIEAMEEWSGKGSDIFATVQRAFMLCDDREYSEFLYDADGVGADGKGASRVINETRRGGSARQITAITFRGSGGVERPEAEDVKGRKNQDFFLNLKAQSWWSLRTRFYKTYRAVKEGAEFKPDELISIPKDLPHRAKLVAELSQPTYKPNAAGKIVVDKAPEGAKSPNLADAVMMRFSPIRRQMVISQEAVRRIAGDPRRMMRR